MSSCTQQYIYAHNRNKIEEMLITFKIDVYRFRLLIIDD